MPAIQDIPVITAEKLEFAANVLKLIASPVKLALIHYLNVNGERSVNDICEALETSQPLISHHLANLKAGGVLKCRREGKFIFYSLNMKEVITVLDCMSRCELNTVLGPVTKAE